MSNIKDDLDQIIKHSKFLLDRGFIIFSKDEYSICFSRGDIQIDLFYERYDNYSSADIKFLSSNCVYSIGWILAIYCDEQSIASLLVKNDKLKNILSILDFIELNFNNLMLEDYCKSMMSKVEEYILKRISD